jgi:citrate lyase subunit beta/citryl-CoA lyase
VLENAPRTGADVLIQELEDFTPPERRHEARNMAPGILRAWRDTGQMSAVRINPLEVCGLEDLDGIMPGHPDVVMMAMVSSPEQVRALDQAIAGHEARLGIPVGSTEIVPNIETAAGLVRTAEIVAASRRVTGALLASEDLAADLGAERTPEGHELAYARQRFLLECAAAGIVAIDCPCTFSDLAVADADIKWARRLGYKAKSVVHHNHILTIHRALTPSNAECQHAEAIVAAFQVARAHGQDRAMVKGHAVEVPTYRAAKRLLERYADFQSFRTAQQID